MKEQLKASLSTLPAPLNDYEIVVPEDEESGETPAENEENVEDQADIDAKALATMQLQSASKLTLILKIVLNAKVIKCVSSIAM